MRSLLFLFLNFFFLLFQAYRLKKCPPPPAVENAEVIYEDEDFHIGKNLIISATSHTIHSKITPKKPSRKAIIIQTHGITL